MGECARPENGEPLPEAEGEHPLWLVVLLALLVGQGWMALGLFGARHSLAPLLDDQPIVSGRHPLHLYHGFLGARAWHEHGSLSCYDPAFHAGYPKTPVFDAGSRPAELMLAVAGGQYRPAAYKVGLALLCALVPLLVYGGARGAGLDRGSACLACAFALLVWWGQPCRDALEAGDVDLLGATVLVLVQAGLLLRYHRAPGPLGLLGVVVTGLLGWYAHPLLLSLLLPVFLVYYLSVGTRHRLAWHAALLGGLLAAVGVNAFWLLDWLGYWWIRVPLHLEVPLLPHRTLRTVWEAPLWGGPVDRGLAMLLLGAGLVGVVLFNRGGARASARLLGLAAGGFLLLALAGITWEPLGRFGTAHLLVPALLFAALPAAHAIGAALALAMRLTGRRWVVALLLAAGPVAAWLAAPAPLAAWANRLREAAPLQIGLTPEQAALVATLDAHTTPEARVLWEDRRGSRTDSHWTALLPLLLPGRSFVGGLDPDAGIEHAATGLVDQALAGRPLEDWSEGELLAYCERYNIGWVVCWSEKVRARFTACPGAEATAVLHEGGSGRLYTLRRRRSFALTGSARWLAADARQIVLADVRPERVGPDDGDGQVLLSLHYQAGMRVSPSRVRVERAEDPRDHVPFVRLRVADPVALVTITWDRR